MAIAYVYAILIIKGRRTFKSVPDKIKEYVKEELTSMGHAELAVIED